MEEVKHGFVLKESRDYPDNNMTAYLYVHQKHGCPFFHIKTPDNHNFFRISFNTICDDNSGSTHVLEHIVLCGSEKYPISQLFNELNKRSIAQHINALTSLGATSYQFSTTNSIDFHNNLDVYLDAVFHPNLNEINFLQEGHRIEPVDINDPNSPLKHSGVVFNEMCGALDDPNEIYSEKIRAATLPDTVYKYIHGGDPDAIALMTLEDIKKTHQKYYNPSNSYMFHYGSFDIDKILEHINKFIDPIETAKPPINNFPIIQSKWDVPKYVNVEVPMESYGDKIGQYRSNVVWFIGEVNDFNLQTDFYTLDYLLSSNMASPLFKALIKTNIGTSFTYTQTSGDLHNFYYSIGLCGMKEENVSEFHRILYETLEKVVEEGFPPLLLESVLHQYEFSEKEMSSSQGRKYCGQIMEDWMSGFNPFVVLDFPTQIAKLRERLSSQPHYLEGLIKKYLLDNNSKLTIVAKPVKGLSERILNERNERLNSTLFTKEERESFYYISKRIIENQNNPAPVHLLPEIKISDLNEPTPCAQFKYENDIYTFPVPTNDIIYISIKAKLPLTHPLLQYFQIFEYMFCAVGGGGLDESQFSVEEDLYTSGIFPQKGVSEKKDNVNEFTAYCVVSTACLTRNVNEMIRLLRIVLFEPDFSNDELIQTLINETYSDKIESIPSDSDVYATIYAASKLNRKEAFNEFWSGLSYLKKLNDIVENNKWKFAKRTVTRIYKEIFRQSEFKAAIHCEEKNIPLILPKIRLIVDELNSTSKKADINNYSLIDKFRDSLSDDKKFFEIDSSTNCTVAACSGCPYIDPLSTDLTALAKFIESEFLEDEVRGKQGAYNVSLVHNAGTIIFATFHDTNSISAYEALENCLRQISENDLDEKAIERIKIKLIASSSSPSSPKNRGGLYFYYEDITVEDYHTKRQFMFNISKEKFINALEILKSKNWRHAIFGNPSVCQVPDEFIVEELL